MRWTRGASDIERLVADGSLQRVTGGLADGGDWVVKARRTLGTALGVADGDPESAFVLAYDAARYACTGLLVQQGLRPTTKGGHYAVEQALRAQFGEAFRPFGALRRRRHELEYPAFPGERMEPTEVAAAVEEVAAIVDAVDRLLPEVGLF